MGGNSHLIGGASWTNHPKRKEYDCESIDQQAERGFLLMVVSGSRHRFGFFGFGNVVSISSILAQEGGVVEEKH